ncbi:MAG: cbbX [Herbinix sp.]|jgi:adenylate kinase family enzyme|nr:cbbX [Herbinix sp.]
MQKGDKTMAKWKVTLELKSKWIIEYRKKYSINICKEFIRYVKEGYEDKITIETEKLDFCSIVIETNNVDLKKIQYDLDDILLNKLQVQGEDFNTSVFLKVDLDKSSIPEAELAAAVLDAKEEKKQEDMVLQKKEETVQTSVKSSESDKAVSDSRKDRKAEEEAIATQPAKTDRFSGISALNGTNTEEEEPVSPQIVLEKINSLIGANEFKDYANELAKVAPRIVEHNLKELIHKKCVLFSIDQGFGFSTYAEMLAELMDALGLFGFSNKDKTFELTLAAPDSNTDGYAAERVISQIESGAFKNKLLCIDCKNWLDYAESPQFRKFLKRLYDYSENYIVVFKIPFIEKEIVRKIQRSIQDIWSVQVVSVVPYDNEELTEYASRIFENYKVEVEEDVWEVLASRIIEEKSDGRFYGFVTIEKIVNEFIYKKVLNSTEKEEIRIKKYDVVDMADLTYNTNKSGFDMLDELVGLDNVKDQVRQIIAQIEFLGKLNHDNKDIEIKRPVLHMRFIGNPGTGKTTVARIVSKILKEKGVLRKGNLYEYFGRDLCGKYVGHTTPKTMEICRDAYGSVLFIDEAYTLNNDGIHESYGKEAIETLALEMENHSSDMVVILAGYKEEMDDLMQVNAGLASRIPYCIEFPNYTREQLYDIFIKIIAKNFHFTDGFEDEAKKYFESLPQEMLEAKDFSNARYVRNLSEKIWAKAALRIQLSKQENCILLEDDIKAATADNEFLKMQQKKRNIGFRI